MSLRLPDAPWRNGLAGLLPGTGQGLPNPLPSSTESSAPAKPEPVDEPDSREPLAAADAVDSLEPSETAGTLKPVDEPDPLEPLEAAGTPETLDAADNLKPSETTGTLETTDVTDATDATDILAPADEPNPLEPLAAAGTPETADSLEPMPAADIPETTDTANTLEPLDTPDDQEAPFMGDETEDAAMTDIVDTLMPATPEPETELLEIQLPPLPDYRWDVQVLAGRSLDRVREDSEVFMRKNASMLKNLRLAISRSRFGDTRDEFYRLRVMGWDSQRAAADWCGNLRSRGQKCLVVRVVQGDD